ncbi:MAG: anaerobic ribonucleoside-triphosphate reductase activating protein [Lachnospiraceae bacterium]|nr:anaerobic ribonucleoside-triphosphate reductase activating protein [Lachnospiraceae bacterium]
MTIHGLNKTTLLDYPGHLAATIFTGGCNFRCPFCHNASLVRDPASQPTIPEEEIFSFLKKRRGILEGVCITGGEPTLAPDLADFVKKIKDLGLLVKLDSNGYKPDVLHALLKDDLLDCIAMDIKNAPARYGETVGIPDLDITPILRSVDLIRNSNIPFEFRTTLVKEFHSEEDVLAIGEWLRGVPAYFLQSFIDSHDILMPGCHAHDDKTVFRFRDLLIPMIPSVQVRGLSE